MSRVLVTGAAGFIGSHLVDALLAGGHEVVGVDAFTGYYSRRRKERNLAAARSEEGFRLVEGDLMRLDLEVLLGGVDVAVHLAGEPGVRRSWGENFPRYVERNVLTTGRLLEAAGRIGVAKFVYASSSSVYGGNETLPFRVEDRVDQPLSLYAATKKADELISETYAHLYRLPQTGLRFFTVYGPWGRPDMAMWLFTKAILAGEPIDVFGEGNMRRDFTYIDDIVTGIVACHDNPPPDDGQVKAGGSRSPHRLYNIGNNRSEELTRMIEIIEKACGREAQKRMMPMQAGDVRDTYADISAIQRDLGFTPTTPIDEGVPRFVAWYREHHGIAG